MKRRILSLLIALCLLCSLLPSISLPGSASTNAGVCGENLTWTFDEETGILRISGTGDMYNYTSPDIPHREYTPWLDFKITSAVIDDGVTSIGSSAFAYCSLSSITIPDSVTNICAEAFRGCVSLESVTIPSSVTTIHSNAFYQCNSLTNVVIPESVTSIGDSAFTGCSKLSGIWVAEDNPNYSNSDEGVLFDKNKQTLIQYPNGRADTSYTIPTGVTTIKASAFSHSTLTSITIPTTVANIGSNAFIYCGILTSILLPRSVSYIGENAFSGCDNLTAVAILNSDCRIEGYHGFTLGSSSVTTIYAPEGSTAQSYAEKYEFAFVPYTPENCEKGQHCYIDGLCDLCGLQQILSGTLGAKITWTLNVHEKTLRFSGSGDMHGIANKQPWAPYGVLVETVIFDGAITSIGDRVFESFKSLTSITIPYGVTKISDGAFKYCYKLESVWLPGSVADIFDGAFYGCNSLTSITIPESVTYIEGKAFSYCSSLSHVHFLGDMPDLSLFAFDDCADDLKLCYIDGTQGWENCSYTTEAWDYTLTSDGTADVYTCNICNEVYFAHKHNYIAKVTSPTCMSQGYTTYTCELCGDKYIADYVPAAHNFTIKVTPPTCTTQGYTTYTCELCGDKYIAEYVPAAHDIVVDAAVEATCTEAGLTEGKHCGVCGEMIVAQEETAALGHNYSYISKDAFHTVVCENCDDSYTEAHTYVNEVCVCGIKDNRYGISKSLNTGSNNEDDAFSLGIEVFQKGILDETPATPIDFVIVMDRSESMSQPASVSTGDYYKTFTSYYPGAILYQSGGVWTFDHEDIVESADIKKTMYQIEAYLKTLDTTKPEGYYRATNFLKRNAPYFSDNHVGFAAEGYASWEPLRYNTTTKQWEMRITNDYWGVDCPGGINTVDYTVGSILNKQVQWMSVTEAYKEYCARIRRNIYVGRLSGYCDFVIAIPKLTRAANAIENFIHLIYDNSKDLPQGQSHRISILGFGGGALYVGGKYEYKRYDPATDRLIRIESVLKEDLGISQMATELNSLSNLDRILRVIRSPYTYSNTRTDWALEAVEKDKGILPAGSDGRKQVVLLITDGAPTSNDNMELAVANNALVAAKRLKDRGVEIFTVGMIPGLDAYMAPAPFDSQNPGSPRNANSFLMAASSMYPGAISMGNYGVRNASDTPYYIADDGSGNQLVNILSAMKDYMIPSNTYTPSLGKGDGLVLYEELNREFKPDNSRTINVCAYPYLGSDQFGSKVVLGQHAIPVLREGESVTIRGGGYTITLSKNGENVSVKLHWTDGDYGYLREVSQHTGGYYDAAYPKGYKLYLELPIAVDRDTTAGGNNIPVDTGSSGLYLPGDGGAELGECARTSPVVNANVAFYPSVATEDYEMDFETYLQLRKMNFPEAEYEKLFGEMYSSYGEYAADLEAGKFDYLNITLDVEGESHERYWQWLAQAGDKAFVTCGQAGEVDSMDWLYDQQIRFLSTLSPITSETDSCGVPPYLEAVASNENKYVAPKLPRDYVQIKHTLNLASDIAVNYAVESEILANFDAYRMEVLFRGEKMTLEPVINGPYTYFTMDGITAVDLNEELDATLYLYFGNNVFGSVYDVYSVSQYAYAMLDRTLANEKLKAVCANLLRYGALAQAYKGSPNPPADEAMTDAHRAYLTDLSTVPAVSVARALGDLDKGIPWIGKTLVLDSKVTVRTVFNLGEFTGNLEDLNLRVTYTNIKGEACEVILDTRDVYDSEMSLYSFSLDTLLASEMRAELAMALYEKDVQVSETHIYSVESYCAGKAGSYLGELAYALLAYSDAARDYFLK